MTLAQRIIRKYDLFSCVRDYGLILYECDEDQFAIADAETGEVVAPSEGTFGLLEAEKYFSAFEEQVNQDRLSQWLWGF